MGSAQRRCCCSYYLAKYCNGGGDSDILIPTSQVTEYTIFTVAGDNCTGYFVDTDFDVLYAPTDPDNQEIKSIGTVYDLCVDITIQCNDCTACIFPDGKIPRWMRVHVSGMVPCGAAIGCAAPTSVTVDIPYIGGCRWQLPLPYVFTNCSASILNGSYPATMTVELNQYYVGMYWGANADCNNIIQAAEYFETSPPDCDPEFSYSMEAEGCGSTHCFAASAVCYWLSKAYFRLTECSGSITITAIP